VRQSPPEFIPGTVVGPIQASQLTANFNLSNSKPGQLDLVLLTVDGLRVEFERAFTVQAPAPKITDVAQAIVEESDEILLEITGQYFRPRAIVTLTSPAADVQYTGDVESLTEKLIVARFNLSLIGTAGWKLVVTNPDGQQSTPPTDFTAVLPAPLIESFVPRFADKNSKLDLTIRGQYFQSQATVSLEAEKFPVLADPTPTVKSAQIIESSFDLKKSTAAAGLYFVVVTNPDNQQAWSDEPLEIFDQTGGYAPAKLKKAPAPKRTRRRRRASPFGKRPTAKKSGRKRSKP
jgi:hypothetical protein